MLTEKIIHSAGISEFEWVIIRPTSIWGPWFGEPYRNFFDVVRSRKYFKIDGKVAVKTFGYVGNAICQIDGLMQGDKLAVNGRTFYIGDQPATNINEWADEVAAELGIKLKSLPIFVFKCAAWLGDVLQVFKIKFPMSSFRLSNMRINNVVTLLDDTFEVVPKLPYSRREGIKRTLKWLSSNDK